MDFDKLVFDDLKSCNRVYTLLVECGRAVQVGNLKLADETLGKYREAIDKEDQPWRWWLSECFAEALVRYLYNISPPWTIPVVPWSWTSPISHVAFKMVRESILAALPGKRRLHLIDLCFPDELPGRDYWSRLVQDFKDVKRDLIIRITVVLLEGDATQPNNYADLAHLKLQGIEIKMESIREVYFPKMEGELEVVHSYFSLDRLLHRPHRLGMVLALVRNIIRPDFMIMSEHDHASLSASPFLDRFVRTLRYLSRFPACYSYLRSEINNMCSAKVLYLASHQWRDLLLSQGFEPLPLPPNFIQTSTQDMPRSAETEEKNSGVVLNCYNLPMTFTSIWKPAASDSTTLRFPEELASHHQNPTKLSPHHHPCCKYLNKAAALAQIFDVLGLVCQKRKFPLALTWTAEIIKDEVPSDTNAKFKKKQIVRAERNTWYGRGIQVFGNKEKVKDVAQEALDSIYGFQIYDRAPLPNVVAMKLRISYTGSNDYIVQFWVPDEMGHPHSKLLIKTLARDMQLFCKSLSVVCHVQAQAAPAARTASQAKRKRGTGVSLSVTLRSHTVTPVCCLTLHFINEDWLLEKKEIGRQRAKVPAQLCLPEFVKGVLSHHSIDQRLISLTVQNAYGNEEQATRLKRCLTEQNLLVVNGDFFHIHCFVDTVNLMVQDILHEIQFVLLKIRLCIANVKGMGLNPQGIEMPCLDVQTRWDSTYLMLESALELKEAFDTPSEEEWDKARVVFKYLKVFHDLLHSFGENQSTPNNYFPVVSAIHVNLLNWEKSSHAYVREMANRMKVKFDKYWRKSGLVLAVAVVLDPRYKFLLVEVLYKEIYGKDASTKVCEIRDALVPIYDEYAAQPGDSIVNDTTDVFSYNVQESFAKYKGKAAAPKSELHVYLEEPTLEAEDAKFEVLEWWRLNSSKYPTLGRIARDILAIPMSLSGSDSLFSLK